MKLLDLNHFPVLLFKAFIINDLKQEIENMSKQIFLALSCLMTLLLNIISTEVQGEEIDKGLVIIDNKPWKISWVKENEKNWVLLANFDKGELRTYFKKAPPSKGFGLSHDNKPTKQEFKFYSGKKFTSTVSQFEQWPDGAKGYAFTYEQCFERDGNQFELGTTAIIEEVGSAENEIRYAIFKNVNTPHISIDNDLENDADLEDDNKSLSELPEFEQLVHKSLTSKLDLLMIHRDFIHKQNTAILEFMKILEDEKDNDGTLPENRLFFLLNQHRFPKIEEMMLEIQNIHSDFFIKDKIRDVLEIIKKNSGNDVNNWFENLEKEILEEIDIHEKSNLSLPQYKLYLSLYTKAKEFRLYSVQMMRLMNPKIFNN